MTFIDMWYKLCHHLLFSCRTLSGRRGKNCVYRNMSQTVSKPNRTSLSFFKIFIYKLLVGTFLSCLGIKLDKKISHILFNFTIRFTLQKSFSHSICLKLCDIIFYLSIGHLFTDVPISSRLTDSMWLWMCVCVIKTDERTVVAERPQDHH